MFGQAGGWVTGYVVWVFVVTHVCAECFCVDGMSEGACGEVEGGCGVVGVCVYCAGARVVCAWVRWCLLFFLIVGCGC